MSLLQPVSNFLGTGVAGPGGVAPAPGAGDNFQGTPNSSYVYDPNTGGYVLVDRDRNGNPIVTDTVAAAPNLANQTAGNQATQATFLQQQQAAQAAQAANTQQVNGLIGSLKGTISGTGPGGSVAQTQLGQGLQQIQRNNIATAAGATGENSNNALRTAMATNAEQGTALNGQQAGLRAQETTAATNSLGSLLSGEANNETTQSNNAATAATNYAGLEDKAMGTDTDDEEKANEANAKSNSSLLGTLGNGVSAAAALL